LGFLIIENVDYANAAAINRLLFEPYAVEHPLLPGYLASIDGTTIGVQDDDPPDIHSFTDITGLNLLDTKGIPWITHLENYLGGCLDAVFK
jgi:hypothetical protein